MSSNIPDNLKYTKEHEWIKIDGEEAYIGITDFAQSSLGDIVFLELPEDGTEYEKEQTFGVVESIKSVSDLFMPISATVLESNSSLVEGPEKINEDPYESWLIKVKIKNAAELDSLLNHSDYSSLCEA